MKQIECIILLISNRTRTDKDRKEIGDFCDYLAGLNNPKIYSSLYTHTTTWTGWEEDIRDISQLFPILELKIIIVQKVTEIITSFIFKNGEIIRRS